MGGPILRTKLRMEGLLLWLTYFTTGAQVPLSPNMAPVSLAGGKVLGTMDCGDLNWGRDDPRLHRPLVL